MTALRRICFSITFCLCVLAALELAIGDISLPKYFSDHMVLQQNRSMRVWGKSEPEEKLTVKFKDQSIDLVADQKGNWSTKIKTGPAGGPFQLEVASQDSETKVVFSNVLVGEVWVCGGQSNMSVPVSKTEFAEADIASAKNFPRIRLFQVGQAAANEELADFAKVDPWYCCSSETIKGFSAIGYFFARELSAKLDVPIGLIQLDSGAVPLESWISNRALKDNGFNELLDYWNNQNQPNNPAAASSLFNGMVSPMSQTPIGGVLWYHGTANIGRGEQYSRLFPLFIKNWREHFQSDLPFYFVQPSPFRFEDLSSEALPEIWDAQLKTFKKTNGTGMVVTTDLADAQMVHNNHKLTISKRLSSWAFANCYFAVLSKPKPANPNSSENETIQASTNTSVTPQIQEDSVKSRETESDGSAFDSAKSDDVISAQVDQVDCSGPIFESAKTDGNKIVLTFRYADSGLKLNSDVTHGFTICGEDKKFLPAQVKIDGSQLEVFHAEIDSPVAVRYGWTDTARPALTNSTGLPASPFRTDEFQLSSSGIEF